jgi:glycosyltransferase involved in cell wall biosynthesis
LYRVKILFTSTHVTSFMSEDVHFLRSHFSVVQLTTSGTLAPLLILRGMRDSTITFTWFASVYAGVVVFLARMLGRKSIVVIGGVDLARFPDIDYGLWTSRWKSIIGRYTLRHADRILAVDPSLADQARRVAAYDGRNIAYVPTGYDASRWTPGGEKEQVVLTVAHCSSVARMKVKGIDVLLEAARMMSSARFVIIGLERGVQATLDPLPGNVELVPPVQRDDLLAYYRRAKVYCQPSMSEGFPNSLCEAMLCECIPVGTTVGGTPTAIAHYGELVPYGDVPALVQALTSALQNPGGSGGRLHIASHFPQHRREESLLRIIEELTQ